MIIIGGRRVIPASDAVTRVPIHFYVTDMAVHKADDVFGIVIQRAV